MKPRSCLSRLLIGIIVATLMPLTGCYSIVPSSGGGEIDTVGARRVDPRDVAVPAGYQIDVIAQGLTFPTSVAIDETGQVYVVESGYSYGEVWTRPRLARIESDGSVTTIVAGAEGEHAPWNGVAYHDGSFYIAQGGERGGGRIVRVSADGQIVPLVENLPSLGDHHTNGPAIGPDGAVYFAQGTATNSGVVGPDNAEFGWLRRHTTFHDIPAKDIVLTGQNFESKNALDSGTASTGAFVPYGTSTSKGQVIKGQVPFTGGIMRIARDAAGGTPEMVAWGMRNPYGLAFAPDGQLYVTENSYDVRGSRPVWGTGDLMWRIEQGTWYGWPDYHGHHRLDQGDRFQAPNGKPAPKMLLAEHPNEPPKPVAIFGVHSSSNGLDFSRSDNFGHVGQAFVAQFGDMSPTVGKTMAPVGFKVVRVDVTRGVIHDFAVNRGKQNGPASKLRTGGFERPNAVRFSPDGRSLYIVDFGVVAMSDSGARPMAGTGVIWRIRRSDSLALREAS